MTVPTDVPERVLWRASELGSLDDLAISVDFESTAGVAELREVLVNGRGIALVRGWPLDGRTQDEIEALFWRVGEHLGTPVSQSVMGERLGHVIDHTDVDPHARAYRRNEALTPHSDPTDILGFLCLQAASEGGANHFVSSMAIHEELRRTRPDLLERLYRGYHYHRFGEQGDDEEPITPYRVPVFSVCDGHVSARLVRQYIEMAASESPDIELDDLDREALDLVDRLAVDPAFAVQFTLQPGEAVFANNYTTFHARTGFWDPPGAPKRHLLRLWLETEPTRPIVPEVRLYSHGPGVPPQPGRTPSYDSDVGHL